jgi:hypothetical protein
MTISKIASSKTVETADDLIVPSYGTAAALTSPPMPLSLAFAASGPTRK